MSHNYQWIVGNMSILSVESHWQREQKRDGHIYGGRGN